MNTRKKEVTANSRLFNKSTLAAAVATVIAGSTVTTAFALGSTTSNSYNDVIISGDTTIDNGTSNATTNYIVGNNATLSLNGTTGSNGNYYGNFTSSYGDGGESDGGLGSFNVNGNVTLHGNVGQKASSDGNGTGNWTLLEGNTLTLAENVTVFNAQNLTMSMNTTLNLGSNATTGINRASAYALTYYGNISMAGNSTINIGNGTTVTGSIYGLQDGKGTLSVQGNVTSGGTIGGLGYATVGDNDLEVITVNEGNTFTLEHESLATNYYINGTVTAKGQDANMTGSVNLGNSGILNLYNKAGINGTARVIGSIDGVGASNGTLNINGTYTTQGVIGGTYALSAINLDTSNNASASVGHTVTFSHNVNATTIKLGTSTSNANATLSIVAGGTTAGTNIVIGGDIVGGGNSTSGDNKAGGRFYVQGNTTIDGSIGSSNARLADIRIQDGTTLTITGASRNIYANNITLMNSGINGLNATLSFNGSGTTNVYGVIAGELSEGEGLVQVNNGTVHFRNTVGSLSNYISGVYVGSNATLRAASHIYANETIEVRGGTLDIQNSSGVTITANSGGASHYGLKIGDAASNDDNGTLETNGTITLSSSTKSSGGTTHEFNNATIKLNGTHGDHATSATAYIDIGTNNQTLRMQGNTTVDLDLENTLITDGGVVVIVGRGSLTDTGNNGTLFITGNVTAATNSYAMFGITINNSTAFSTGGAYLGTQSLNATVNYSSAASLGLSGNTLNVYNGAKTAIGSDTTVFQALAGMTTNAQIDAAIATMHPATGGAAAASASISGSSMGTASTRMAYTRQTGLGRGMNAGGATLDESMWVQIFGADVDQDNVGGVSGYDADGQGLAIGIDGMSEDGMTRIGIAGSFANTDVTGKDSTTKTTTDIDTTQVMVYANKVNDDGSYLEGTASYAFNDNTGTRRILVGSVDRTASSSYDSGVFAANVEAGWPKENDGVTVTPTLGLAYSHLSADAYTETGASGMNLNVTPSDYDTFEGKAGVKVTGRSVDADGGVGRPEVRIGVTHNFGDDTADSTATFTAGGSSFTTTGVETDSTKVDLGLGYTYTNPEGDTDISVNIDGRKSSSYLQYGGGLTVKWKF